MTLIANLSASIRPLGEEHLRMFRRVVGSVETEAPKVKALKEARRLLLSEQETTARNAKGVAKSENGKIANLFEIAGDKEVSRQILASLNFKCFVDWKTAPTTAGFYRILPFNLVYQPILSARVTAPAPQELLEFPENERLWVFNVDVSKKLPLLLGSSGRDPRYFVLTSDYNTRRTRRRTAVSIHYE